MSAQSMQALQRANEVRLKQADLRRQVKAGEVNPRDLLIEVPDVLRRVKIGVFLTWCPRIGDQRASEILRSNPMHPIGPSLQLGQLGERTRHRLARALPATAAMRRAA